MVFGRADHAVGRPGLDEHPRDDRGIALAAAGGPEHAVAVAERLGFSVHDTATGGASDANSTAGLGVPSLDGLGPIGGNDHSPAEYLDLGSVVPRTAMVAGLILAISRDPVVAGWRAERGESRA